MGQYVSPTERLFDVVNTGDIHLALKVFEKDLNKIALNQRRQHGCSEKWRKCIGKI
jgi:cobalt-zinc-cadmium efflux system membrane fusion protein